MKNSLIGLVVLFSILYGLHIGCQNAEQTQKSRREFYQDMTPRQSDNWYKQNRTTGEEYERNGIPQPNKIPN